MCCFEDVIKEKNLILLKKFKIYLFFRYIFSYKIFILVWIVLADLILCLLFSISVMALCRHVMYLHNIIPWRRVSDPGWNWPDADRTLEKHRIRPSLKPDPDLKSVNIKENIGFGFSRFRVFRMDPDQSCLKKWIQIWIRPKYSDPDPNIFLCMSWQFRIDIRKWKLFM